MEKSVKYQTIVHSVFSKIANGGSSSAPELKTHFIHDPESSEFVLMMVGWSKHKYSHGLLMHVQIIDGKVWVHQDRTDFDIGNRLVQAGIPKKDIVLGFVEPMLRKSTEFAAA